MRTLSRLNLLPGVTAAIALCALALPFAGCGRPEVPPEEAERAAATLQPFKKQLLAALEASLAEGVESPIEVCRDKAPEIAAGLSVDGVRMGRTSHKLRNPANAPQAWVEPLLAAYVEDPTKEGPMAVYVDESTIGYVEPIKALSICTRCHGPAVDPELLARIRELYPEDQAVGFRTGDLRGLFWLTLAAAQ